MSENNNMMLFPASCDAFPSNTNLKIALLKLKLHKHLIKTDCNNYKSHEVTRQYESHANRAPCLS